MAQTINQGSPEVAEKMLSTDTDFAKASSNVTRLIVQLRGECSGRTPPSVSAKPVAMLTALSAPRETTAKNFPAGRDEDWETF